MNQSEMPSEGCRADGIYEWSAHSSASCKTRPQTLQEKQFGCSDTFVRCGNGSFVVGAETRWVSETVSREDDSSACSSRGFLQTVFYCHEETPSQLPPTHVLFGGFPTMSGSCVQFIYSTGDIPDGNGAHNDPGPQTEAPDMGAQSAPPRKDEQTALTWESTTDEPQGTRAAVEELKTPGEETPSLLKRTFNIFVGFIRSKMINRCKKLLISLREALTG